MSPSPFGKRRRRSWRVRMDQVCKYQLTQIFDCELKCLSHFSWHCRGANCAAEGFLYAQSCCSGTTGASGLYVAGHQGTGWSDGFTFRLQGKSFWPLRTVSLDIDQILYKLCMKDMWYISHNIFCMTWSTRIYLVFNEWTNIALKFERIYAIYLFYKTQKYAILAVLSYYNEIIQLGLWYDYTLLICKTYRFYSLN